MDITALIDAVQLLDSAFKDKFGTGIEAGQVLCLFDDSRGLESLAMLDDIEWRIDDAHPHGRPETEILRACRYIRGAL